MLSCTLSCVVILDRKVLKMQRYSSVTLNISPKNPISAGKKKITFSKIQILAQNFFPEWFGPKQIEAIRFPNEFHDNSAQTDCSKEMWIPILKGLKHLKTFIMSLFKLVFIIFIGRLLRTSA